MTIPTIEIPYKFEPRWYQLPIMKALDDGCKRVVCCHHRGAGKDLMCLNYLIKKAVEEPGVYLHCFPNFNQGKRAIWKSVHDTHEGEGISYLDHFPKELIKNINSSEMMVQLHNGSIYCVMGLDGKNAARARGMNPKFVILSEYAFMDPEGWRTIEPRISQNKGTAVFISTPNGKNHFWELFDYARLDKKNYFSSFLTIDHSKTISLDHIDQLRKEGFPEDFIQQEYFCSFERGSQGSYYGKHIQKARDENRFCDLPIFPDLPCHTSWDIGIGDSTSIWVFQALKNGCFNFVEYYENQGEGLEHYIHYLKRWQEKYGIEWGRHFVPHDMKNREFTSGVDRLQTARDFGLSMTVVPKKLIEEGIQAVRSLLSVCYFDKDKCSYGIKCLDFYRKKYNEALKVYYDEPCHDKYSHGADAFRMFAVGAKSIGFDSDHSISSDYEALQKFWG